MTVLSNVFIVSLAQNKFLKFAWIEKKWFILLIFFPPVPLYFRNFAYWAYAEPSSSLLLSNIVQTVHFCSAPSLPKCCFNDKNVFLMFTLTINIAGIKTRTFLNSAANCQKKRTSWVIRTLIHLRDWFIMNCVSLRICYKDGYTFRRQLSAKGELRLFWKLGDYEGITLVGKIIMLRTPTGHCGLLC